MPRQREIPAMCVTITTTAQHTIHTRSSPHKTDLAQRRYFDDPAFVNYLTYLQYWRRPEYAKYRPPPALGCCIA